ncbi:uncharacterized protein [Linepithema humile]|uniref:uncharacterized protein isoform X2 n=1 Tax=Linepithema humile TaxID=83485 RepID=UPI00351F6CEF
MSSRCATEDDGRRRIQFSKDERLHLLNVMSQYAPLLDDKDVSVFDRREIWRAIERDFRLAGFIGKTSAQLKKYWQNYKYHGRRVQTDIRKCSNLTSRREMDEVLHPEVAGNCNNSVTTKIAEGSTIPCVPFHPDTSLRNVVESGCHQRQIYEDNGTLFRKLSATPIPPTDLDSLGKNRFDAEISQKKRSSKVYGESKSSGVIDRKLEKPIGTDVIVSNTDISDNSVTVSVICPERTPELFTRNQPKRKREDDASLDRSSFQSSVSVTLAASPSKKRKDDDHSIFPAAAGAAKGRCFLLQPRQTDNHGEVISDRGNMVEKRRKLEPAKKKPVILPSKYASRSEVLHSKSAKKIPPPVISRSEEKTFPGKDSAASFRVQDIEDTTCYQSGCEESKIHENATSRNHREDDLSETDTTGARTLLEDAGLWDRDTVGVLQSELRDELGYRLMLHRLETEEKRLKVKIAEMAIQEIRFRIQALNEDIRRADELHELHLALATAQADTRGLHA